MSIKKLIIKSLNLRLSMSYETRISVTRSFQLIAMS